MKFRPSMQLRLRGVEQFEDIQKLAKRESVSVNEWVLLQIEKANPSISIESAPEPKKVKPKAKASAAEPAGCDSCGAVGGLHQRGCKKG